VSVGVVLVAAGAGTRLGSAGPKALVEVAGRTLLARALAGLDAAGLPPAVVVHTPGQREAFVAGAGGQPVAAWVPGGASRTDSVRAGVAALPVEVEVVAVHDAARPLTPPEVIRATVAAVDGDVLAAAPGLAVADTLKRITSAREGQATSTRGDAAAALLGDVVGTVDRTELVGVQTPQVFPRPVLAAALAAADEATDDLALVERLVAAGEFTGRVVIVPGSVWGWKVTRPNDLALVTALAAASDAHGAGG
jgi:2-C-methyl-D-erythritol 4-phosphate cytidylyltransferase